MPRVIKWKLHGKVCFTLDKTHQEKGTSLMHPLNTKSVLFVGIELVLSILVQPT